MNKIAVLAAAACLLAGFGVSALAGTDVVLPRHPSPSPDGTSIAFSWQGDLWIVPSGGGVAARLTAHASYDGHPVWSRDGKLIAFSSNRFGNDDIFVMAADGSLPPRRLTHASWADRPVDFTADGTRVLFVSRRDESIRRTPALYSISVDGGTPRLEQEALAHAARLSPDGRRVVFVRGGTDTHRQGYRGSANRDLWLREADGTLRALTTFEGDDDEPSWIGDGVLVYLSTKGGPKNLYRLDLKTGEDVALTSHAVTGVRAPRAAANAPLVAYEWEDGLWTVSATGGAAKRVPVSAPADWLLDPIAREVARQGASGLVISPDGETAAFLVDADVFVVGIRSKDDQEIAPPRTVRVTATAGREGDLVWSHDGQALYFTTDRAGQDDIYRVRRADEALGWSESHTFVTEPVVATAANERAPLLSPDGKTLAFFRNRGDVVVATVDGKDERVLFEHWYPSDLAFSPDGQWLAFSRTDVSFNSDVFIIPVAGGEAYNVSRHPDDDTQPAWSPDGRRLVFLTKRHQDTMDVWGVWLTRADDEHTPEGWLKLWKDEAKAKPAAAGKEDDDAAKSKKKSKKDEKSDESEKDEAKEEAQKLPTVAIDFDRLWERARPLTKSLGDEGSPFVAKDGKRVYFTAAPDGKRDLYSVRFDGEDLQQVTKEETDPGAPQFTKDGKTIFFVAKGGTIKRIDPTGKAGDPVPFEARYERVEAERRAAVFDEAVRKISENFYDPNFHGIDAPGLAKVYRPWALAAATQRDFSDVVNGFLGEFNASHMGYRELGPPAGERTGGIGVLFDPDAPGKGIAVRAVLDDTPATRRDVNLVPGERLLAVDDRPVNTATNVYALFTDTAGRPVRLEIEGKDGARRTAIVEPIGLAEQGVARYRTWVRERERLVERLSGGRLGYIHIESMDIESFEGFERALFSAAEGKEGLVIDVRSNGGGWTTDYLMAVLQVQRHAFTIPRGAPASTRAYPQSRLPFAAWTRPAITLCDEESYSNAEIFSWAFQTLGRGLTAGTPTFGAVISTGGTRLLDGRLLRLPFRGFYVAGSGTNMENNGFVPDLVVPRPPAEDTLGASDTQLARAIERFLAVIEQDPRYGTW